MAVRLHSLSILCALCVVACGGGGDGGDDAGGDDAPDATVDASDIDAPPPPDASPPDATPQSFDCDNLPLGTNQCTGQFSDQMTCFIPTQVSNAVASEDLAFDAEGNLVGSNDDAIFKTSFAGDPQVFVPSLEFRAGLQFLKNGDLMVADNVRNLLLRIDPDGVEFVVLGGWQYPNGVAVDNKGFVYVTEHDAGRVRRVDPVTGEFTIILDDGIGSPNGIAFNAAYDRLYLAGFDGDDTVYTMTIEADGTPGTLEVFASNVGSGRLDGIGVDACGNVYICDYGFDGDTDIIRFSEDGSERVMIMRGIPGNGSRYVPNIRWGSGVGGWDKHTIYMPDGWNQNVLAIDIGVPSATHIYP